MIYWIVPLVLYVLFAIFCHWMDAKDFKNQSRVAYNPTTGKHAYSYKDGKQEKWVEI